MCTPDIAAATYSYVQDNKPPDPGPPPPPGPGSQDASNPDLAGLRKAAKAAAAAATGQSTMLTGAAGVSPSLLALGKNTLLGA